MNLVPAQRVPAWRQKYDILRIFLRARFRRFRDRATLEAYQESRIQQMLTDILPRSPYTAQRLPNQDVRRWREMPIIGKTEMMEHFDTLNTAGLHLQDAFDLAAHAEDNRTFEPTLHGYTVGLSSGTSGSRGVFVVSPSERALWAGEQLAHWLPAIPWKKERIAFFLRANSQLYGTLGSRHIHFQFFDLAIPLEQHIDTLNRMNPTFLTGPPSVLAWLARQQKTRPFTHTSPHNHCLGRGAG